MERLGERTIKIDCDVIQAAAELANSIFDTAKTTWGIERGASARQIPAHRDPMRCNIFNFSRLMVLVLRPVPPVGV